MRLEGSKVYENESYQLRDVFECKNCRRKRAGRTKVDRPVPKRQKYENSNSDAWECDRTVETCSKLIPSEYEMISGTKMRACMLEMVEM